MSDNISMEAVRESNRNLINHQNWATQNSNELKIQQLKADSLKEQRDIHAQINAGIRDSTTKMLNSYTEQTKQIRY